MTNYEKIKKMSVEEMAEFLASKAFITWKSEQPNEVLRKLNATQIRAVKQHCYNCYYRLLQKEVEE